MDGFFSDFFNEIWTFKITYIIHLKPSNTGKQNLQLERTGGEKVGGRGGGGVGGLIN